MCLFVPKVSKLKGTTMVLQSDYIHAYVTTNKHSSGLLHQTCFPVALDYIFGKYVLADMNPIS